MNFFQNINSFEELKVAFRSLAKENHPDAGGNEETMKAINKEYDILFPIWKYKSGNSSQETSHSTRNEFYTQHGYKGENYSSRLGGTQLNAIFRDFVKMAFPTCRFSIYKSPGGWTPSLYICLMEAPFEAFKKPEEISLDNFWQYGERDIRSYEWAIERIKNGYAEINRYSLDTMHRDIIFTDKLIHVFKIIKEFVLSYNFDDSDAMIDYFNTNFYFHFEVGKFEKPFKMVPRKAQGKYALTELSLH